MSARDTPPLAGSVVTDVGAWLRELGLGEHAVAFAAQHIDGELLETLTDSDLKELGVASLGHRRRILRAIAAQGRTGAAVPDAATQSDGERRQVAVLFADLANYTALTHELGSEAMHALTEQFFTLADRAIVDHGGRIEKRIGDCVMAVFGAPVAHTDDAERAVRAALAIQASMPSLAASAGRVLAVHIGVAMGEVTASTIGTDHHRQYAITGDSVNLAARLTARAGDGEILASAAIREALAGRLAATPLEALPAKGFDAPVPAWRVQGLSGDAVPSATPFVGRQAELAQLVGVVEGCRDGVGTVIHVRGEAGIGKSRLLAELRRHALASGFGCHSTAVLDFGTEEERHAIRRLARSLADGGYTSDDGQDALVQELLGQPLTPEQLAELTAMEHSVLHQGRLAALARLVRHACATRPSLIVVEDVHWADEPTLDHLARVAAEIRDCPALLVTSSRIEGDPLGASWRARTGVAGLLTVDLGPLRESDADELAHALLANTELAHRCVERANGNPLFLEQLLRHATDPGSAEVPGTVQSVVLARADRLPSVDHRALQAAAVLGQRFQLPALRYLLGDDTYSPEMLIEHALVRPEGEELAFIHALIRDGMYASLLRSSAKTFHLSAATWYGERDPMLHAEHLDRAGEPAAAHAYVVAAKAEVQANRMHAAVMAAQRGLACARERAERYELGLLEAQALLELGDVEGSLAAYRRTLDLAMSQREQCAAHLGLAACMRLIDHLDDAFIALDAAERAATAEGLVEDLAQIHYQRGNLHFPQGRFTECRAAHERALTFARRAGSAQLEARALSGLGDVEYMRGHYRSAREHFAGCIALCRAHDLRRIEVANHGMLALTLWFSGEPALEEADRAVEAAHRVGYARGELIALHVRLLVLTGLLQLDEARASIARAQALVEQLGAKRFVAENLWYLATVERLSGNRPAAAELLREALAMSRKHSFEFFGGAVLGSLALCTDDAREREAALASGEALLDSGSVAHNHFLFARDAIDAALDAGQPELARRFAGRLRDYTASEPVPWADLVIARAEVLATPPDAAPDREALEEIAAMARRLGLLDLVPRPGTTPRKPA